MHKKMSKHLRNIPSLGMRLVVLIALMALSFNSVLPVAAAPLLNLSSISVGAQSGSLTAGTVGTVTFSVTVNRTGTTPANFNLSVSGLPANASATFSLPNPVSFSGSSRTVTLNVTTAANTPAGTSTLTVSAAQTGSTTRTATRTLTINPAPVAPTITFGPAPTPTYLGGNFTVSATTNSTGALTYSAVSGPCALVSGATFSTSGAGICVVRASTAATTNFLAGSAQQSVTIAPAIPTIGFAPDPYPFFPGGNFTVFAATNSDGARTYSKVSGPCNLVDANLGTFTPTGTGACVVQVNTAATTNFVAGAAQQSVTIIPPGANLYAVAGSTTLPSGPVNIWGYNTDGSAATKPGGPTLEVNQGALVAISLHNNLNESTSLLVQGQTMIPDLIGVPPGGSKNYVFTADHAGTYLYEAGLLDNAQHQVAMGLYGVLIVRPATAGQAYADGSTAYNDEAVVLLSELDPALNNSNNPAAFDLRNYHPKYWLINGKAHPNTDPISVAAVGDKVLLRYVNAGLQHHSMAVLGLNQTLIAQDGSPLAHSHQVVAETIAPGETTDALTTIPATAAPDSKFALYDANAVASGGGMVTFLKLGGTATGGDTTGPTTGALTLVNNAGAIDLSALVDDTNSGGSNITAAEYYIDSTSNPPVAMSAVNGFDSPTEAVSGNIAAATLGGLSSGSHTIYVRGQDAAGNWGAFALATIAVDHTGPTVSGLVLSPNPSNGTTAVALSATGDDSANGNNPIAAAEYTIDGGAPQTMAVNNAAPIASLTASIPASAIAALLEGPHTIAVRSQDSLGNWGAAASKNLLVDKTAPTTNNVTADPNPNNGSTGFTPDLPVIRVTATFNDTPFITPAAVPDTAANHVYLPLVTNQAESAESVSAAAVTPDTSYVKTAEGFLGTTGANGAGFPFAASDGLFDSASEQGYADIPLTTLAQLCSNTCPSLTVYVHAQDGAGNWETTYKSVVIVIDKVPPTVSNLTLTPAATNNAAVVINASATDATTGGSNIKAGEYFIDNTTGAAGTGTTMNVGPTGTTSTLNATIPAATVAALTAGTHTVSVRAKDSAGNWGALVTRNLIIDRTAPTISNATITPNPTNGATTISVVVSASDTGGSGLNGGVYWIDGSNTTPPSGAVAFNGTTSPITISGINVSTLTAGTHNLRVRVQDAAGNVSTVRSTSFTVSTPPPDAIFANGFETGNSPWGWSSASTNTATRLNVTTSPALVGTRSLQAQGNNTNYVQYNFGTTANPATATFDARFYFNPNGNTAATTGQDIFQAATTNFNTVVFRVRYRVNVGQAQVQIQVGNTNNGTWVNITNATHRIEVVWQAVGSGGPTPGTLVLYVDGVSAQTLNTTSTNSVAALRMGSVTSGGNSTLEYFDAFSAKRSVSPLIGP